MSAVDFARPLIGPELRLLHADHHVKAVHEGFVYSPTLDRDIPWGAEEVAATYQRATGYRIDEGALIDALDYLATAEAYSDPAYDDGERPNNRREWNAERREEALRQYEAALRRMVGAT